MYQGIKMNISERTKQLILENRTSGMYQGIKMNISVNTKQLILYKRNGM